MKRNFKCLLGVLIFEVAISLVLKKVGVSKDINALSLVVSLPLYFLMLHKFLTTLDK